MKRKNDSLLSRRLPRKNSGVSMRRKRRREKRLVNGRRRKKRRERSSFGEKESFSLRLRKRPRSATSFA